MLAEMPSSQHEIPMREHSHLDISSNGYNAPADSGNSMENRLCPGCKKSAVDENGGLVVAFGQSFFHVDCFKCAKCANHVTADTNLLLLSDGSPICANCSYSCNVCHLPILDEAIMTGDDSYHAHCFKCKVCKNRIDELVFAKTSQGIYCMNCHSERMIKIRRHAQKKAERERAGGSGSSHKSRDREARNHHSENGHGDPGMVPSDSGKSKTHTSSREGSSRPQQLNSQSGNSRHLDPNAAHSPNQLSAASSSFAQQQAARKSPQLHHSDLLPSSPSYSKSSGVNNVPLSVVSPTTHRSPQSSGSPSVNSNLALPNKQSTLPVPPYQGEDPESMTNSRRRSYDDGVRPLNVLFGQNPCDPNGVGPSEGSPDSALEVPTKSTSRSDKRRSIMPGLSLADFNPNLSPNDSPATATTPVLSPTSMSLHIQSKTPNGRNGWDSPNVSSPLRDRFSESTSSRPTSHGSTSSSSVFHSSSSSPVPPEYNSWVEPNAPRLRSTSSSTYLPEQPARTHATPVRPLPRPTLSADRVPPRISSLADLNATSEQSISKGNSVRAQRSFEDRTRPALRDQHRLSSTSSLNLARSRSTSRSRPSSRADVPRSVESGTDTEAEGDETWNARHDQPPAPPPKEEKDHKRSPDDTFRPSKPAHAQPPALKVTTSNIDPNGSMVSIVSADGSDDMSESSPIQNVSHSTFIAPALPPIRFSMSGADFTELLSSVGGLPSLKSLDRLAGLSEEGKDKIPPTPPPTAASFDETMTLTPRSGLMTGASPPSSDDDHNMVDRTININSLREYHGSIDRENSSSTPDLSRSDSQVSSKSGSLNGHRSNSLSEAASISTLITLTEPGSDVAKPLRNSSPEFVMRRLQESLADANDRGAPQLKMDKGFVEAIVNVMEKNKEEYQELKSKFDGMRRTSQRYVEGLTVAQTEYDKELNARRDAEGEVTRLRVLLSGQAARLTALSGDMRRQELRQQMSEQLNDSLTGLERDLSRLKVQRDMTLAEVEELSASKSSPAISNNAEFPAANLGRSLTMRLDHIKTQYQHELIPLTQQREGLNREISELQAIRNAFLEETTVLNVRNEELAQLSAQYHHGINIDPPTQNRGSIDKPRPPLPQPSAMLASLSSSTTALGSDESPDSKYVKIQKPDIPETTTPSSKGKFMKWGSKAKEMPTVVVSDNSKVKTRLEHSFQQSSVLRFARCDHCGDKMWGSQLRCVGCNLSVHTRCMNHVLQVSCSYQTSSGRDDSQLNSPPPSMFGRLLTEQVESDAKGGERQVPVIVEKCIDAVETLALDFEGIYRKTGGSGQTKQITQMFERGDYDSFDLRDTDRFNDICAVTSVLKTYFRTLPDPLLTFELHEQFMVAIHSKDTATKNIAMLDVVNKLPNEHYYTLRMLMLHLHRVREQSDVNLMNARNLGVVFGPTLMRSRDPSAEFSDMAGKALSVEWLVENAARIFKANLSEN